MRLSLTLGRKKKVSTNLYCCVVLLLFLPCGVGHIHQTFTQTLIITGKQCYTALAYFFLIIIFFQLWSLYHIFFAPRRNLVPLITDGFTVINLSLPLCLQNNYLVCYQTFFCILHSLFYPFRIATKASRISCCAVLYSFVMCSKGTGSSRTSGHLLVSRGWSTSFKHAWFLVWIFFLTWQDTIRENSSAQ